MPKRHCADVAIQNIAAAATKNFLTSSGGATCRVICQALASLRSILGTLTCARLWGELNCDAL
eukprot:SAG22_NODE_625_length_8437_cov_5.263133_3_plen_63_part_00